ncbi:MAG: hypothetical protein CML29_16170 [Rhizobiales bacterium]|nr:hypothetical protein [Hyphomicrobiales bacterium]|tara:strand:+ start:404 stop:979 length:576 start_codon:yes stop_codon:yes gene_type:complete
MFMFILQTFILIAIAFVIGAVVGCWMRSAFAREEETPAHAIQDTRIEPEGAGATVPGEPPSEETVEPSAAVPVPAPAPLTEAPPQENPRKKTTARKAAAKASAKTKAATATPGKKVPAKAPGTSAGKDDLKKIKGVGRVIETKLNAAGITTYAQIAAWTKKDAESFSEQLDFRGRIEREKWISQAKKLAKG